ncbi:MAG TPA: (5-formylfuran-3-yl)methyl phosphate synthase [Xanthobacteraceae bacterium]
MTFMLASVTGGEEAEIATRHGADIVDLKDITTASGSVAPSVVKATVDAVAQQRPVSAVAGEPEMDPERVLRTAAAIADAGASYVKVGLYPRRRDDCIRALSSLARRVSLIGVMFADHGADAALIPLLKQNGFRGAMVDTADKRNGRLFDHMDITVIGHFVDTARTHGLMAGLAGSLEPPDIPRLLLLAPDVLGFRRALCVEQDRTARLDAGAVDVVRALIPADPRRLDSTIAAPAKIDYRLLAARGYSFDPHKDDGESDRIFVRDFVLPIRIGAYAHERNKPQRVRFDVDIKVLRPDHPAQDIRDVFSYDLITDSIRMIVAQEHISLVEMLAERIAALILTHRGVTCVTVRVEKLDVGPGGVGVEIVRRRASEVAKVHHLYPAATADADPKAVT